MYPFYLSLEEAKNASETQERFAGSIINAVKNYFSDNADIFASCLAALNGQPFNTFHSNHQ